jgi:hypothetical protein
MPHFNLSVSVDLLKNVPPLSSEEPKVILNFSVQLKAIYNRLAPDTAFKVKLLPRVQGRLLNFFDDCIRDRASWEECKAWELWAYFQLFVKEKLTREMVMFCFQKCAPRNSMMI